MNMPRDVKLKKCQLLIIVSTTTYDAVSGGAFVQYGH